MTRLVTRCLVAAFVLATASAAYADHTQTYWPLKRGNTWTYDSLAFESQRTVAVESEYAGMFYVTGIPTLHDAWLTWSGNTLYVWDDGDSRWEPLFRFGAATGTTYTVRLSGHALWSSVDVTVRTKSAAVTLERLGRTFTSCVGFGFAFNGVADAGLTEAYFAPYRGMIAYAETSLIGEVQSELTSAVYSGRPWGLNYATGLEGGSRTGYTADGTNKVKLINTRAAWETFYAAHKPGETAPDVDFSTKTVCVVLAGVRATSGYVVKVNKVVWNYPYASVTVHVDEFRPTGIVLMVLTTPYHIVVLDKKVYSARTQWVVQDAPEEPPRE